LFVSGKFPINGYGVSSGDNKVREMREREREKCAHKIEQCRVNLRNGRNKKGVKCKACFVEPSNWSIKG